MGESSGIDVTSLREAEEFWSGQAGLVDWFVRPKTVLTGAPDASPSSYEWFSGGRLNTCYNALDRQVIKGRAEQTALIYDSPVTGTQKSFTYAALLERVAAFAGALRGFGVEQGDRVVICMPMIPEAVIAMLACARLGAVHSFVAADLGPAHLAERVDRAGPKVMVAASCGLESGEFVAWKPVLDLALELADHAPDVVVIKQREQVTADLVDGRDVDWELALKAGATDPAPCASIAATAPLYLLDTTGSADSASATGTVGALGQQTRIVRDNGGHAVALAWLMRQAYDLTPGQVWWAPVDVGSALGHSAVVYGPLIAGATTVLYEASLPAASFAADFWRVIANHQVEGVLAAPEALRAIREAGPATSPFQAHEVSRLHQVRRFFVAGETVDAETARWAINLLDADAAQLTDSGWPVVAALLGVEPAIAEARSAGILAPGYVVAPGIR